MLRIIDAGLAEYNIVLGQQKSLVSEVASGSPDVLLLCEHIGIVTLGRKYNESNLFLSREELALRGLSVQSVDRGGDVSLHAPGQLIFYPIINLRRSGIGLKEYLRKLEQVAVDLLAEFDIVATGDDGNRGVWVGQRKIASIGIGVTRWVTYHGMGLNINIDLSLFKFIRPCGLDVRMTSLSSETKSLLNMNDMKQRSLVHFKKVFGYQ